MDTTELIKYLGWIIPGGFGFIILRNLWLKFFHIRPKILINIKNGGICSEFEANSNQYNYRWQKFLVLSNDSIHLARKITILEFSCRDKIKNLGNNFPEILNPDEKEKIEFSIHHSVQFSDNQNYTGQDLKNLGNEIMMKSLDGLKLVLVYESVKSKKFYTSFFIRNSIVSSNLHFFRKFALKK